MTSPPPFHVMGRVVLASVMVVAILNGCMFFDEIDRCLDRGGRWNETTGACELDAQPSDESLVSEARPPATALLRAGRAGA